MGAAADHTTDGDAHAGVDKAAAEELKRAASMFGRTEPFDSESCPPLHTQSVLSLI